MHAHDEDGNCDAPIHLIAWQSRINQPIDATLIRMAVAVGSDQRPAPPSMANKQFQFISKVFVGLRDTVDRLLSLSSRNRGNFFALNRRGWTGI